MFEVPIPCAGKVNLAERGQTVCWKRKAKKERTKQMKKLMFVAALASSFAAVAANDCTPEKPTVVDPTLVYSFKASVKTTKGIAGSTTTDSSTICTPGTITTTETVIRTKDSTKFQGWIYDCTATCSTIADGTPVVWDSKRKAQLTGATFTTDFINVMGKKQSEAEWAWTFTGTAAYDDVRQQEYQLKGAGLGKFDAKKGYYTSFSGNFAGTATASYDLSSGNKICDPSQIWKCDALTTLVDADTVAYGTWSAKYDKSASKKFAQGTLKVPSYVDITK